MKNLYQEMGVRNILLVEDDPWTRDSLSLYWQIEGCRPRSASTAAEAIAALSAEKFDVIVCEHLFPGMDGLSLLKLFGDGQRGAVKLLIAPHVTPQLVEEADRCGIHDVLRKPFLIESLETCLKRHLTSARGPGLEPVDIG